ncbi:FAD-dependent oxidoreductase [Shigella flexneri]
MVEAGDHLACVTATYLSAAHDKLTKLGVRVLTRTMVTSADEGGLHTKDGEYIGANLMVWAAGIKSTDFLKDIGGLELTARPLVVEPTLQTTPRSRHLRFGDCAYARVRKGALLRRVLRLHTRWRPAQ